MNTREEPTDRLSMPGAVRLFRIAGIAVFLHWSWFLVAVYEVQQRAGHYRSVGWNVLEYLFLFGFVLLHEFGHALACRSVGGRAERILLWPLGGVAYVEPPQRPGAMLWSIAAGPLVNVALVPLLIGVVVMLRTLGVAAICPDGYKLMQFVALLNIVMLVFNLLPIYPLDGGQMLWSLLWFLIGRAKGLMVTAMLGFVGVAGVVLLAIVVHSAWYGVLAAFLLMSCWRGLKNALALARIEKAPAHAGWACPVCGQAPRAGPFWRCNRCQAAFDTFEHGGQCPQCAALFAATRCLECGRLSPCPAWRVGPPPLPPLPVGGFGQR